MAQLPPPRPLRPLQCPARTAPAGRGPGTKAASARAPHPSGLRRPPFPTSLRKAAAGTALPVPFRH